MEPEDEHHAQQAQLGDVLLLAGHDWEHSKVSGQGACQGPAQASALLGFLCMRDLTGWDPMSWALLLSLPTTSKQHSPMGLLASG